MGFGIHLGYVLLTISTFANIGLAGLARRDGLSKVCTDLGELGDYTKAVGVVIASQFCSAELGPIRYR